MWGLFFSTPPLLSPPTRDPYARYGDHGASHALIGGKRSSSTQGSKPSKQPNGHPPQELRNAPKVIGASQALLGSKRPRSKQFSGQPPPELHGPARVIGASQALPGGKRLSSKPGSQCRKQHKGLLGPASRWPQQPSSPPPLKLRAAKKLPLKAKPPAAKARAASHALPGDKRPLLGPASRWPQQPSYPPPLKLRATKKLALKAKPPPVLEVKTKPPPVLPLSAKPPPVLQLKAKGARRAQFGATSGSGCLPASGNRVRG